MASIEAAKRPSGVGSLIAYRYKLIDTRWIRVGKGEANEG